MTDIIGLTGGIASGKSTVANLLRDKGAVVVDADVLARDAVAKGSDGLAKIAVAFGDAVLTESGELDRKQMGEIVFGDEEKRKMLNAIVHPEVARLFGERLMALAEQGEERMVYEVPLLFENNLDAMMTATILVATDEERQIERMKDRDGLDDKAARARIDAQMPLEEKRKRATHIIENTSTLEALSEHVDRIWSAVTRGATP